MTQVDTAKPRLSPSGVAGLLSIELALIGNVIRPIWTFPDTSASSQHLAKYFAAHSSELKPMMLVYTITITGWLVFGAAVAKRLRTVTPPDSTLPVCFLVGLIGFVTLLFVGFTCFDVLIYRTREPGDASVLYDLA